MFKTMQSTQLDSLKPIKDIFLYNDSKIQRGRTIYWIRYAVKMFNYPMLYDISYVDSTDQRVNEVFVEIGQV